MKPHTENAFLPIKPVRARYGNISSMTINRWVADPELNFPKPTYFGRLRFWKIDELEAWEATRPRTSKKELA